MFIRKPMVHATAAATSSNRYMKKPFRRIGAAFSIEAVDYYIDAGIALLSQFLQVFLCVTAK